MNVRILNMIKKSNTFVIVFNVPDQRKMDNHYETIPMVFIIKDKQLITITNNDNQYITRKMKRYLKESDDVTIFQFYLVVCYLLVMLFSICGRNGYG